MELYSVRNGLRKLEMPTKDISVEMYALLFQCCKKHFKNLTYLFHRSMHNVFLPNHPLIEFSEEKFLERLKAKIPALFHDKWGQLVAPDERNDYDQHAIFDLIEYIAQNVKDISEEWDDKWKKQQTQCLETNMITNSFRNEINTIFTENSLLFTLTPNMVIERIPEFSTLTSEVQSDIEAVDELVLRDLLIDACHYHRDPNPESHKIAVDKIWDAFERLKTYYTDRTKNDSAEKIIEKMSNGIDEFKLLFDAEFGVLTKIGNGYRIRHHETDTTDIQDIRHYDYFFNRCLALIATAIQYLN